jgi:diadenosine tetraphosphate (Ap4A) HIT family hydrolase
MIIFQTDNFTIETREKPHISRQDGGHITISPVVPVEDRTKLSPELAKELMKLTMITGEAMKVGLAKNGINLGRINYMDMGNWNPKLHLHLYGRAINAPNYPYGTYLQLPSTPDQLVELGLLEPLNEKDISDIKTEIERLLKTDKYDNF